MYQRAYNTAGIIRFPLKDPLTGDLVASPTFATGDCKISKDGGILTNSSNLPVEDPNSSGLFKLELTATELTAAQIVMSIVDQSSPKVWADAVLLIETFGNVNAQLETDLANLATVGAQMALTAASTNNAITAIKAITDTLSIGAIGAQFQTVIETNNLDHLAKVSGVGPADNTILALLASSSGVWAGYNNSTDSLQALRDRGDAAWITATSVSVSGSFTLADGSITAAKFDGSTAFPITKADSGSTELIREDWGAATILGAMTTHMATLTVAIDKCSTFDPTTDEVNVGAVNGVTVTGISDFYTPLTSVLTAIDTIPLCVWHTATSAIVTAGTIGVQLKTNCDATISTRSSHADPTTSIKGADSRDLTQVYDFVADKTGYKLASDGLDSVSVVEPASYGSNNFREMVIMVHQAIYNKRRKTLVAPGVEILATFKDNATTILCTQACTSDDTYEIVGAATTP